MTPSRRKRRVPRVREAKTRQDILRCYAIVQQLRPHVADEKEFLGRVRTQVGEGYRIAFAEVDGMVRAFAGFRIFHMLYQMPTGRLLYVDDLVTDEAQRSTGLGAALMEWLVAEARREGCDALELDSGVQRVGAHRFYLGQGMHISSYHFQFPLKTPPPRTLFEAPTPVGRPSLEIRPMTAADIPHVVQYWTEADADDLTRMSVDPEKIPSARALKARLEEVLVQPERRARTFYLTWVVQGRPIGYSALKDIVRGDHAGMHLHMWDPTVRGRSYGATLFCMSALDFYERFHLKSLICEPSANNPAPNRMLEKIGFRKLKTYRGASSDLSAVTKLHRFDIRPRVAERFLAKANAGP